MKRTPHLYAPGDRVAYSAGWLKSCGFLTGPVPFLRGTVNSVEPFGNLQLCRIAWDGGDLGSVINPNLTLVSRIAIDAGLS